MATATNKEKRGVGQPLLFGTPEELQKRIDDYFETSAWVYEGEDKHFRPTMTGLARHLKTSRETLRNYSNRDEYFDTIKDARDRVAEVLEQKLYGNTVTGIIFNLKNNFGWKDKNETELSGGLDIKQSLAERLTGGSKR